MSADDVENKDAPSSIDEVSSSEEQKNERIQALASRNIMFDTAASPDGMRVNEGKKIRTPFQQQLYACRHVLIPSIISGILKGRESRNSSKYISAFGAVLCAAVPPLADTCGIFASAFTMYYNGRRKCTIAINLMFMIPPMIYVFDPGVLIDFAALLIYYLGRRFLTVTASVFLAEMTEPKWRAAFLGTCFIGYNCGHGVFWFIPVNSLIPPVFSLFLIVTSMLLSLRSTETPYCVGVKGRNARAEELFFYLRGDKADQDELDDMLDATVIDRAKKKLGLLKNLYTKRFITPCFVIGFMTLGTANTCFFYDDVAKSFVKDLSSSLPNEDLILEQTILKAVLLMFSRLTADVIYWSLVVEVRRRNLYALSVALHMLALLLLGLAPLGEPYFIFFNVFCSFSDDLGSHQLTQLLSVEIFPAVVREFGSATHALMDLIISLIQAYVPRRGPVVYNKFSDQVFWGTIPVGIFFSYLFMPETINAPLTETERLARDFNEILHRKGFYEDEPEEK